MRGRTEREALKEIKGRCVIEKKFRVVMTTSTAASTFPGGVLPGANSFISKPVRSIHWSES